MGTRRRTPADELAQDPLRAQTSPTLLDGKGDIVKDGTTAAAKRFVSTAPLRNNRRKVGLMTCTERCNNLDAKQRPIVGASLALLPESVKGLRHLHHCSGCGAVYTLGVAAAPRVVGRYEKTPVGEVFVEHVEVSR